MEQPPRKRGRPSIVVTEAVLERRRLAKQRSNAMRARRVLIRGNKPRRKKEATLKEKTMKRFFVNVEIILDPHVQAEILQVKRLRRWCYVEAVQNISNTGVEIDVNSQMKRLRAFLFSCLRL